MNGVANVRAVYVWLIAVKYVGLTKLPYFERESFNCVETLPIIQLGSGTFD